MKDLRLRLLTLVLSLFCISAQAQESQHWVCETEALYRELLSARLYGVGKDPAQGCIKLPTGVAIEQLACEETDFELCQYRWDGLSEGTTFWGSPIIKPLSKSGE